jgi:preprotein translocase subunit YajC
MLYALLLFAQENGPKDGGQPAVNPFVSLLPLLVIFGLFWLLIIRPSMAKERKQREDLMTKLKKNDEVITSSGIIGVVTSIKETGDEVTIRSDETRLRILKSSIARIIPKAGEDSAQDASKRP